MSVNKYIIAMKKISSIVMSIIFIAFGIFFFLSVGPKTIKTHFSPYKAEYVGKYEFIAYEAIEKKSDNKKKYLLNFKNDELGITVNKKVTYDEYWRARFKGEVEFNFDVFKISNGDYYCSKKLGITTEQAVKNYKAGVIGNNWSVIVASAIFFIIGIGLLIFILY